MEAAGNAPAWVCLQGRCITLLPRPHYILASRPGAAPGGLSFGDSAAQAGARPNAIGAHEERSPALMVAVREHLNHNREIKRAGIVRDPGPCHFNKEQTPLGDLFDPNPRFHGGSFGV